MSDARKLIAAAIRSRSAYEVVQVSGEAEHFSDVLRPLWTGVQTFYEQDPSAKAVDREIVEASIARNFTNPKHAEAARSLFNSLCDEEVSAANVAEYVRLSALDRAGNALASALVSRRGEDEVTGLISRYQQINEAKPDAGEAEDFSWTGILTKRVTDAPRIKITPASLNERLRGGLLPGHNVTLFGRPESGKTALALTMACGFARRGHKTLYAGNEDPVADLMVRAVSNLTGRTIEELEQDPEGSERLAIEKGAGNLIMRELAPGTLGELERLCRIHRPEVLIVDQLRNLSSNAENFTRMLDKAAQGVRNLGKKYGMVTVSVTQAGDSASGKPVLDLGDIDSSNTGIPGAADVLIGIGVTDTLEAAGQRMLSICKNKITSRHEYFTVNLDPQRSRIRS